MSEKSATDYQQVRIDKLKQIREQGTNPYPDRFVRSHNLKEAKQLPPGTRDVTLAGRLMTVRIMGKLSFVTIQDQFDRMQVAFQRDTLGTDVYTFFKKMLDIGDFIGIKGETFITRTGEKTLLAQELTLLSKSLRPLPEKFHGITDVESCYRQRYLDLIMNEDTRKRFALRHRVISIIRRYLDDHDFTEVETPILCNKPSGALAKPFITHHNSLDIDVYMRIAPETYLKRLIIGGFDKVYEFARSFRNEGMDSSHLQDFTMLEYYCAYWNFEDNMNFTESLVKHVCKEVFGTLTFTYGDHDIDLSGGPGGTWPRVTFRELILKDTGIDIDNHPDLESLQSAIKEKNIEIEKMETFGRGNLIDQLYKKVSRPKLIQPVFLVSHPIDLSPLARRNDENGTLTDRFQLVINGWEVVNAYSELIDPLDQRERLSMQARLKSAGDEEAMVMDEDYLQSMEYGMPPNSGWGMGIDRFVALLSGRENLRDVVLFPLMREMEKKAPEAEKKPEKPGKK